MSHDMRPPGLPPELPALEAAAAAARARAAEVYVVNGAENTVAFRRIQDLRDAQAAVARRVSAARGRLTKARKTGDPEKIAAARRALDTLRIEADRISRAGIDEGYQILDSMFDRSGQAFAAHRVASAAGSAIIEALVKHGSTDLGPR